MKTLTLTLLLAATAFWSGCDHDNNDDTAKPAAVKMTFLHTVKGVPLQPGQFQAIGIDEQLQVSKLKYYLSNFRFKSSTGKAWAEPESYHLLQTGSDGSARVVIGQIPTGSYSSVEFYFGVDNSRNNSIDWTGDLDPSLGMSWDWETGYRFLVLEGKVKRGSLEKGLVWHIGRNENFRKMNRTFPNTALGEGDTLRLTFQCELDSLFTTPNRLLPLIEARNVMDNLDTARKAADNFAARFIQVKS